MKKKLIFRAPVTTASGYGVHSRQLLWALLESDLFDVSVLATPWGNTSFVLSDDPFFRKVRELAIRGENELRQKAQYDISIQVTIANEFTKMAKVNIGVTAGIEVDRVSPEWLQKVNENIDLLIVPSEHSASGFRNVNYRDQAGNTLRLEKPIVVCSEGADASVFNTTKLEAEPQFKFDTSFNFLFVGLGLDKPLGEDRKNISQLIKWFCERFKDDQSVGLVLKTGLVGNSLMDYEVTKNRIEELKRSIGAGPNPAVHLIHGRLTDPEMAALYKNPQIKALVSLTHGEGFGLPLLEAAACGLPVVATDWSGHVDFLSVNGKKRFVPIEYDLAPIPASSVWKNVMDEGTRWANPREDDVKQKLKKVVLSYDRPKAWADELAAHIGETRTIEKVSEHFINVLVSFLSGASFNAEVSMEEFAQKMRADLQLDGKKSLLYTMPMSAGDVYISTAIVDGLKKKFPEHEIFFATEAKYASILKENPNISHVIAWEQWMANVPLCETIFTEVYTPNLAIQLLHSNWVHGGKGRLLGQEMANNCNVEFGDYFIKTDKPADELPGNFIAFHPGSGKGQWEARNYLHWQEVVDNLKRAQNMPIVQVGATEDPLYEGVIDFRGKTTYNELAYVISVADCLIGIDSVSTHLAAGLQCQHVTLFGSSYSTSTGPVVPKGRETLSVLIDTPSRYSCDKACYKYQCSVKKDHPCVNEITSKRVFDETMNLISPNCKIKGVEFVEYNPKISGYTHTLNPKKNQFPYIQSIQSMLGFCDEVVVVDGGSDDGTLEEISALNDPRVRVIERKWDWEEPGMDGMQKAFGRAMCTGDFLWQQDADEIVHERDYDKIKKLVRMMPKNINLLHLPVVELWGDDKTARTDRHSWKWRLSRNDFQITHGINKNARLTDPKTGKMFAKKGMSDGCEYINIMTADFIPHAGFYTQALENIRRQDPQKYGEEMNKIFAEIPSVYHYSWANIPRKIRNFRDFWDSCWSNLYGDQEKEQRFFKGRDMKEVNDTEISDLATVLRTQGGEHGAAQTFQLSAAAPESMKDWVKA